MNRKEFIDTLSTALTEFPIKERQELIEDYLLHFDQGISEGRTEEQIASELGDPCKIVEDILVDYKSNAKTKDSLGRSILVFVGILFLNLNLMLPIFLMIFSIWASISIVSLLFSFALPLAGAVSIFILKSFNIGLFFLAIGFMGAGLLLSSGMWIATKHIWIWIKKYVSWNIHMVKGRL
jgi:uncharacterized membrane protein